MATKPKKAELDAAALRTALERFVAKCGKTEYFVYVGIDPGTTGAIGFVCGKLSAVVDIPIREIPRKRAVKTTAKERKAMARAGKRPTKTKTVDRIVRECDYDATAELLRILNPVKERLRVIVEEGQVQNKGKFGKSAAHADAGSNNTITAYRVGLNFGMWLLYLASRGWDRTVVTPLKWKTAAKLLKQDKKVSLAMARDMFPGLVESALARVSDHNRAEALLLAAYHRKESEGK